MKNEIEVGEYIRNKYGDIDKVKYISKYNDGDIHINTMRGGIYYRPREIVKHSFNIIDLIEVGDYVNGIHVDKVGKNGLGSIEDGQMYEILTDGVRIETIVTKEQFESVSYKVEE